MLNQSINLPAVLRYRLTSLQQSGMYDVFALHMERSQLSDDSE